MDSFAGLLLIYSKTSDYNEHKDECDQSLTSGTSMLRMALNKIDEVRTNYCLF